MFLEVLKLLYNSRLLVGAKVSDTIRKGIIDVAPYENSTDLLMVGNVAALSGNVYTVFIFK